MLKLDLLHAPAARVKLDSSMKDMQHERHADTAQEQRPNQQRKLVEMND